MAAEAKHCAPGRSGDRLSCFTLKSLKKMATALNQDAADDVDTEGGGKKYKHIPTNGTKEQLWNAIRTRLKDRCGNKEFCWVDQKFAKNLQDPDISEEIFRPKMPAEWKYKPNTWLTNIDIDLVMKQYEKQFPDFLFIGPVPSDCPNGFSCELSAFDPVKMKRAGINRMGIVYNLDKHNQPGSHWVAVYIDVDKHRDVTYYDSYGHAPPPSIKHFLTTTKRKLDDAGIPVEYKYNKIRHQFGGSECGVYSMNYIIQRLYGASMKKAVNKKIPDKQMEEMRKYLFRPVE